MLNWVLQLKMLVESTPENELLSLNKVKHTKETNIMHPTFMIRGWNRIHIEWIISFDIPE